MVVHHSYSSTAGLGPIDSEPGRPIFTFHILTVSPDARSWDNTIDLLAVQFHVYAVDLRFHGESDKPAWGFHVARLAADLHDFLHGAKITSPVLLGSSLGCAIIWSYVELYGDAHLGKLVFVDQAPSQWKMADWEHCSKGIYDAPSLANIQRAVSALPLRTLAPVACIHTHGCRQSNQPPHGQ